MSDPVVDESKPENDVPSPIDPPATLRYCIKCSLRLPGLKFDAHTLCSKCRGQVCSDSQKCDECVLWEEDFFATYLKHNESLATKRRYKAKVRSKVKGKDVGGPSGVSSVDEGVGPSLLSPSSSHTGEGDASHEKGGDYKVLSPPPGFPSTPPAPPGFNDPHRGLLLF